MGEGEGEEEREEKKATRKFESLGWLTESAIMPKKQKAIAGVGPSSILDLKAQLYKSQQELKASKDVDVDYQRAKKKVCPSNPLSLKNSGVDARGLKDKIEHKAVTDGSASYAALERKAELYEKLVKGEVADEEDKEKYCVDFSCKSLINDGAQHPRGHGNSHINFLKEEDRNDSSVPYHTISRGQGQTASTLDYAEHMRFVREVHEEANQAREKVSELKLRRQEQVTARREKLKQAYLKKQLEKLKAASETQQT